MTERLTGETSRLASSCCIFTVVLRVLGIDPGSRHTGFAVVEETGGCFRLVASGTVSPRVSALPERLAEIHAGLCRVIAETAPEVAAVEAVFHAQNIRSALVLGQARGVALVAAGMAGLDVHEYSASEIKRAVVGNGRADKDRVQRMVAVLLGGRAPGDEHACDAVAAAICHMHRSRHVGIGASRSPVRVVFKPAIVMPQKLASREQREPSPAPALPVEPPRRAFSWRRR